MTTEPNYIKQLLKENESIKRHKKEVYKWAYSLEKENTLLSEEITDLKTKLYDATVKEQRLLKILNETDDYT